MANFVPGIMISTMRVDPARVVTGVVLRKAENIQIAKWLSHRAKEAIEAYRRAGK